MASAEDEYYNLYFRALGEASELTLDEIKYLLVDNYINLNKLKGNAHLSCLFPDCTTIGVKNLTFFLPVFYI